MANADCRNQMSMEKFVLLRFGNLPELQILLCLLFLAIYMVTMAGNILIVVLDVADQHLRTAMYFFLGNLSCLEICYTSTILPRVLASLLTGDRIISVSGCMTQFYCFGILAATEYHLLAVMSYDRYLTICNPLRYATLMNSSVCFQLVGCSWTSGSLGSIIVIILMTKIKFCDSNEIDHFLYDSSPTIKLSFSDTQLLELTIFTLSSIRSLVPFLFTLASVCIFNTILRIPSTTRRQKAFSTCSSHIVTVTTLYGTLIIGYMVPTAHHSKDLHKVFSVFYSVLLPRSTPSSTV
ncbi:olfactory receptor 6C4-like [Chelonia mydas]|uniref:olfactory receptor 6C4-like n=1 Tax=Chelonia mydas TaxID=8469 RepID=UPI001CA7EED6|nr:olfactory receptor 6C4-like [Chelonia mydas]